MSDREYIPRDLQKIIKIQALFRMALARKIFRKTVDDFLSVFKQIEGADRWQSRLAFDQTYPVKFPVFVDDQKSSSQSVKREIESLIARRIEALEQKLQIVNSKIEKRRSEINEYN